MNIKIIDFLYKYVKSENKEAIWLTKIPLVELFSLCLEYAKENDIDWDVERINNVLFFFEENNGIRITSDKKYFNDYECDGLKLEL